VTAQHSEPYRKIGRKHVLYNFSLVGMVILDLQIILLAIGKTLKARTTVGRQNLKSKDNHQSGHATFTTCIETSSVVAILTDTGRKCIKYNMLLISVHRDLNIARGFTADIAMHFWATAA